MIKQKESDFFTDNLVAPQVSNIHSGAQSFSASPVKQNHEAVFTSLVFGKQNESTTIRTKAPNTDLLMIGLTAGLNSPNNLCNPSECGVSGIFHFSDNQLLKNNLIRPKKCGSVFAEKHIYSDS